MTIKPENIYVQKEEKLDTTNPIDYCETHYPEMMEAYRRTQYEQLKRMLTLYPEIQQEQYALFCKKQMDYGPGNIAMGAEEMESAESRSLSLKAIIIRTNDKVQRLINLLLVRNASPENESLQDSFRDAAVYATIADVVMSGKWGK